MKLVKIREVKISAFKVIMLLKLISFQCYVFLFSTNGNKQQISFSKKKKKKKKRIIGKFKEEKEMGKLRSISSQLLY